MALRIYTEPLTKPREPELVAIWCSWCSKDFIPVRTRGGEMFFCDCGRPMSGIWSDEVDILAQEIEEMIS